MNPDVDLSTLSDAAKDALILSLFAQLQAALARIGELEKRLDALQSPPKTPDNSSLPPSRGLKPNRPEKTTRDGPRRGHLTVCSKLPANELSDPTCLSMPL